MKCQLLFVATVCLVTVWALPVPDEEVAIQPDAGSKAELLGKTVQTNPIEPAPFKPEPVKSLEPKIDAKTVAPAAAPIAALDTSSSTPAAAADAEPAKTELKLSAADVETVPAIPIPEKVNAEEVKSVEKKLPIPAEESKPQTPIPAQPQPQPIDTSLEAEKKQEKAARTEEEPIEAPKAIPLVEAPAPVANAEVQKQIVDEVKSQEPQIDAKFAEVPAAIAAAPAAIDDAENAEKEVTAEKQPARQERISEVEQKDEKAAAAAAAAPEASLAPEAPAAPALPTVAPAEAATKSETNIQVITPTATQPEKKSIEGGVAPGTITPAAAPAALAAQAKSAEPQQQQAKSDEVVKTIAEVAAEPAKEQEQEQSTGAVAIADTVAKTLPKEQNADKVPEVAAAVADAKKIDEAQPIAAAAAAPSAPLAPLAPVAEPKKSSEEKSESKNEESSESKESDESSESKENVSN